MNELQTILADTANRLFAEKVTRKVLEAAEEGNFQDGLWQAVEENGLTRVLVPEAQGGAGAGWADAHIVLKAAGKHAAPVPLAETILAGWLLAKAGMDMPDGPVTLIGEGVSIDKGTLKGEAARVPYARSAPHAVVVRPRADGKSTKIALCKLADAQIVEDENLAREARDTVRFDGADALESGEVPELVDLKLWGALIRAAQMGGALTSVLEQSVNYALERKQFGKPIGKFQAIQQQLAVLSTHAAAANVAAAHACASADKGEARFEIAAAKVRADEAANIAPGIAHQVHGAIGFTYEHSLHFATRRLWSWRAEYGSGRDWAKELGRAAIERGPDALWPYVTGR
ncbi:acyl-CoA dehydrogenase family protein [Tepidicaulis sp. LMO-SS28]|uniref:acyl-CoA dehydrogenase family protein n=1 Tax=Tepidicaulis sp. LMO-SS28 TaxID=3447455 RepID=UPI003EE21843